MRTKRAPAGREDRADGGATRSQLAENTSTVGRHRRAERSTSAPVAAASPRTVSGSNHGAFGRPRNGCGVRNGASVSTSTSSSGTTAAAARSAGALRKVSTPGKDRT